MKYDPEQISTPPDGEPMARQPEWRQDFPIDTPQDNYIARRDFTKFLVLTSGAFVAGQLVIAGKTLQAQHATPEAGKKVASVDQLPVGGALTFNYPGENDACILLRPASALASLIHQQQHIVHDVKLLICLRLRSSSSSRRRGSSSSSSKDMISSSTAMDCRVATSHLMGSRMPEHPTLHMPAAQAPFACLLACPSPP